MIYLDHHAATPLAPRVADAMAEAGRSAWANPSSVHGPGRAARSLVEEARRRVASAPGGDPAEVVFTSGGTEACDLMIGGLPRPPRVVTWELAHPAVEAAVDRLEAEGSKVTRLPGLAEPESWREAAGEDGLVVVPWVSHETGTVLPVQRIAEEAAAIGARVVVDANQALGRLPVDVRALGVHALAIAAHKIGGPSGAGALWVRRSEAIEPRLAGGGQERGRRGGSPGVLALVGFGAACELLSERLAAMAAVAGWRDRLEARAVAAGAVVNGAEVAGVARPRVASVSNVSFRGWKAEHLVAALDLEGVAVSAGAACSSGLAEPSPSVASLYPREPWRAESAIRMSLGPEGLDDDAIEEAGAILERVVARAR